MYKNFRFYLKILIFFMVCFIISAEELNTTNLLSRRQAVDMAIQKNKFLLASRTIIKQAEARRIQAGKLDNPKLSIGYASDSFFNNEGESSFEVGFEQAFPITGRLRLLKLISDVEIEIAKAEVQNQERLLTEKVELVYTDFAHVDAQLKLRSSLIELNRKFISFIKSRIHTGESSQIELNQIKIENYTLEQEVLELENNGEELLSDLSFFLGTQKKINIQYEFFLPETLLEMPVFSDTLLKEHPEFQIKQLFSEIAEKKTSLAFANRWSDIGVKFLFQNKKSVDEPKEIETEKIFGVGVSLPLPFMNRNQGIIEETKSIRQRSLLEIEAIKYKLSVTAEKFRTKALKAHVEALQHSSNLVSLAEKNLNDISKAYRSGQISLSDLFRSQEQQLKVKSHHLEVIYLLKRAVIQWRSATNQQFLTMNNSGK